MRLIRSLALAAAALTLVGCSSGVQDIEAWMTSEASRMKGQVAPLPPVKPFVPVAFAGQDSPDPFLIRQPHSGSMENAPDQNRKKEFLEGFPLDQLSFVGIIHRNKITWALIKSPDNNINMVRSGNYLGQNYGKIHSVSEDELLVKEAIMDAQGGWGENEVSIPLEESASGKK